MRTVIPRLSLTFLCLAALAVTGARAQSKDELSQLPFLKTYTQERISSYDRAGANDDGNWKNPIKPGETRAIGLRFMVLE